MKKKKVLSLIALFASVLAFSACDVSNDKSGSSTTHSSSSSNVPTSTSSSSSSSVFLEMSFEDKTVVYDGESHSIFIENLPEGASAIYVGNNKVDPGEYVVTARVKYADGTVENLSANLVIEKLESVLTADDFQEAYAFGGAKPSFSLNNTEQNVEVKTYYTPGTYEIELYAAESKYYKESNHVVVNFTVHEGNYLGVKFESANFSVDGSEKEIVASNIPSGYYAQYENNKASTQGKYYAVCKIYNSNDELELTLNAIMTLDNTPNAEFEEYLAEIFADYLGSDYISWNILTIDSASFGFVRDEENEASWYTYQTLDDNYMEETYQETLVYYSYLTAFKDADLSYNQQISYKVLDDYFQSTLEYYNPENNFDFLMDLNYIDQFGGYPANFGTYIEIYNLRDTYDIEDVLSYIKSLPTAFASYLTYAQDKVDAGYPYSDYTLDEMISYLDSVIEQGDSYYLIDILKNNIASCSFLNEEEIANYQARVDSYFTEYFFPAHVSLAEGLENYKGYCEEEGYLQTYGDVGKAYYEYQLRDLLGIKDLDIEQYGKYLKTKMSSYIGSIRSAVNGAYNASETTYNYFLELIDGKPLVSMLNPDEMIDYLKGFATTIVPELETSPDITVKYMDDASAKVSNALAYYMKSPLDSTSSEYITLNGYLLGKDMNETITTMAHEGYPGHLYAYCFNKQLDISNIAKVMTNTAHGEGWAKYVELQLWQYLKTHNTLGEEYQEAVKYYCDYMFYNELAGYLLYTYMDYGIHVEGWSVTEVAAKMNASGFNGDYAEEIYKTLIEMPTQYAAYGYGIVFFYELHNNAKSKLGEFYDEVEYNKVLLSNGWCSLDEVQRISDEYIAETKFLNYK